MAEINCFYCSDKHTYGGLTIRFMYGFRKFCQSVSNFDNVFFVLFLQLMRGSKYYNKQAIICPQAKRH